MNLKTSQTLAKQPLQTFTRLQRWAYFKSLLPGIAQVLLMLALLINPIFWLASVWVDFDRPFINSDYLLPLFLLVFRCTKTAAVAFFLLIFADVLCTVRSVFVVFSLPDLLFMLRFASGNAHPAYVLLACIMILGCFLFWVLLLPQIRKLDVRSMAMVMLIAVLVSSIDRILILAREVVSTKEVQTEWTMLKSNFLIQSQSVFLTRQLYGTGFVNAITRGTNGELKAWEHPTATQSWFDQLDSESLGQDLKARDRADAKLPDKLLLIVVESWGKTSDRKLQDSLFPDIKRLLQLSNVRLQQQGFVRFDGPTIHGELRELCRILPSTMHVSKTALDQEACLPRRLSEQGYQTSSFNVSSGSMYYASTWYPMTGLQQSFFLENTPNLGRCYSWPAGCDVNMAAHVVNQLQQSGKQFVYWLTANSHFPYDARDGESATLSCAELPEGACNYARIHSVFFSKLIELIQSGQLAGTEIILVGDHAPPFLKKANVEGLFSKEEVPFLRVITIEQTALTNQ